MTAPAPSAHSLAARLTARAFALAVDPDRSAEVAVTGLIGLAQGSTTAREAALRRSRRRQFERATERPSADGAPATGSARGPRHRQRRLPRPTSGALGGPAVSPLGAVGAQAGLERKPASWHPARHGAPCLDLSDYTPPSSAPAPEGGEPGPGIAGGGGDSGPSRDPDQSTPNERRTRARSGLSVMGLSVMGVERLMPGAPITNTGTENGMGLGAVGLGRMTRIAGAA